MKKVIALLLAAIMMVSIAAIALAGGDPATCPHSSCHWVVKVKANCMHGGTEWWTCNACGKALYYRNTAKTSHAWAHRTTKYPTFKEMGKVHYYCTTPGCTAQYNSDLPRRDPATATQNEKTAARIVYGDNDLKSGKSGGYVLQLKDALIK